jgi:hypothetical protein
MIYVLYIPAVPVSETYLLCTVTFESRLLSCATMLRACISNSSNFHSFTLSVPKLKITQNGICLAYNAYSRYIQRHGICQVYTEKSRCITFTENYAVLRSSVFYIRLPSTMAWVSSYYIETPLTRLGNT